MNLNIIVDIDFYVCT